MQKKYNQKKYLQIAGLISIALGVAVAVLPFSKRYERLWVWYTEIRKILIETEAKIAQIDIVWQFIAAILLLYLVKCFIPVYFTSTVCFLTGVVLPVYLAIPINIFGLCLQFTVRYFWGRKFGAGRAWKLLCRFERVRDLMVSGGSGNPALLPALRLIPGMPVNSISSMYGSFEFGFTKFLLLSLAGYLPRLISFTVVGRNMFDPLSSGFLVPLMIIFLFTGSCCLSVNGVWNGVEKFLALMNKIKDKRTEKENVISGKGEKEDA